MGRFHSYDDLVHDRPAPVPDVLRLALEVADLPCVVGGYAVLIGSVAWGSPSRGSDIDVLAFSCDATTSLKEDIEVIRRHYEDGCRHRHDAPLIDIILVGAEHEELVERDNLLSSSAPILEPRIVSEIFDRVAVRLIDHLVALAVTKGEPWQTFGRRYLWTGTDSSSPRRVPDHDVVRGDVMREYMSSSALKWRSRGWAPPIAGGKLEDAHLVELEHAAGFVVHLARLLLADAGRYPRPDRRVDVRRAIGELDQPWGDDLRAATTPLLNLADRYHEITERIAAGVDVPSESEFTDVLLDAATAVDFDHIEEFVWRYLAERRT